MTRLRTVKLVIATAAMGSLLVIAASASAADNDTFGVTTDDGVDECGNAVFIDYGRGWPGHGNNDDYVEVEDECEDGHGVKAWVWLNGRLLGSKYNGKGYGSTARWDRFPDGNVKDGQSVGLKVCLVDGTNDPTPSKCAPRTERVDEG